jgi:CPA1 family monovalent cation:H+ antiporter
MTFTAGPGLIVFLLFVATVVAIIARRLRLPTMVGLLIAGVALAITPIVAPQTGLTPKLLYTILLPPLVFEGALNIRWKDLRADLSLILMLVTVGVLISLLIVAAITHYVIRWPWEAALIFGAIVAATDPISVLSSFKEAGVEGRPKLLVEAESLLNDGTAVVAFELIVTAGNVSGHGVALTVLENFARMVLGGVLIGAAVGWVLTLLMGTADDPLTETTLTVIGAYGAYYLADRFGGSGILATVCAGLIMGNVGILGGSFVSNKGREITEGFWSFSAFIANALVFLLMGLTIGHTSPSGRWLAIVVGIIAALSSRTIMVHLVCSLFRGPLRLPMALRHVLVWGGQRGGLGLVLALSVPASQGFARSDVIAATFGVVAFSVLVQGITLRPVLKKLGLLEQAAKGSADRA